MRGLQWGRLYETYKSQPYNPKKVWEQVEKLFKMTKFSSEEGMMRFAKKLRNMGVDEELEKMGVKEGDIIKILDYEFEYTK